MKNFFSTGFINPISGNAMKRFWSRACVFLLIAAITLPLSSTVFANDLNAATKESPHEAYSQFLDIDGRKMHVVMYGDIEQQGDVLVFDKNSPRKTIVFLPAMAVPSPEIYFKPLAEALKNNFNILIVEPFGYGQSDDERKGPTITYNDRKFTFNINNIFKFNTAKDERTVKNINREFDKVIQTLKIEKFILAVHSISGVYAMNYIFDYPAKVEQILALDVSVSDAVVMTLLEQEIPWMLALSEKFNALKKSCSSNEDFITKLYEDEEISYLWLPEVVGYEFSKEDKIKYDNAFSKLFNPVIINEIKKGLENIKTIEGKKFPTSIPVLSFVAGNTVDFIAEWETAHADQLDLTSDNHKLYLLEGAGHYLWYTHLEEIVNIILDWHDLK